MNVKLLLGEGAHFEMRFFRTENHPASTHEIGPDTAEMLIEHGLQYARALSPADEINGEVSVCLGEGGRALWVSGGRDLSESEVLHALAAGLENFGDFIEAQRETLLAYAVNVTAIILDKDEDDAREWLQKPRKKLDGKSPWDLFHGDNDEVDAAYSWLHAKLFGEPYPTSEKILAKAGIAVAWTLGPPNTRC